MSFQRTDLARTDFENMVLDLEKRYFGILLDVIRSKSFEDDLLLIEKEIRENYALYRKAWDLKNKLKVSAERLVRHHVYQHLSSQILGIYPSPISPDLGVKLKDCILCVDVKTIDTIGNANDIRSTALEANQNSFKNQKSRIPYESNLLDIDHYSGLPVLTYIVKLIYSDNDYKFSLSRQEYPTLVLACIPNGQLSKLFDHDIIENFKTYDYYGEADGHYFKPFTIPDNLKEKEQIKPHSDYIFVSQRGFVDITAQMGKISYYDPKKLTTWWLTSDSRRKVIAAVKSGGSVRYFNKYLLDRKDSANIKWKGYIEHKVTSILP